MFILLFGLKYKTKQHFCRHFLQQKCNGFHPDNRKMRIVHPFSPSAGTKRLHFSLSKNDFPERSEPSPFKSLNLPQ